MFMACVGLLTLPSVVCAGAFEDFFLAIKFDDEPRLRALLLKGMDPNTVNGDGFPAITFAMMQDSPNAVRALLLSGKLDPNQPDRRGETPLMVACTLNKPQWVATLLVKGAKQGAGGQWTALHNAAASGSAKSLELLVNAGGEVDVLSPNETTPLMMAAREGREDAVRTLIKLGANPTLINQAGYNAAGYAMKAGRNELAFEIMKKEKALRTAPLKPNTLN
ncbi:MAG: ankyrin repeat domain-containing protein [Gammaproteobacteria bacterium]|uniref:ankyrin repeat domain-containing protein n=1 Tax=Limnobacter sp. TaxID=2003368 RepID=UPI001D74E38F|nr:ankyrin repeat domain-containing protein [Limnobacter sp.]MBU0783204.1 ankyrin repeat domain-containing protein [Gammaproteobacteria bacterium]MDP2380076.1 ankyrin repeat domain-containing protein [Pseudohongiella sp.]MBU0849791.1 ankyrin repeat domain-containing protein [Gammaproteobacteria bacterium]MBU1267101.1 ankyrin repeat domain-containing protein [Gammaproteobacteria bacterium]MBU1779188.1 ankyrin repeat domain-containing protein [Gammaproteobacteria bacterium]